MLAMLNVSIWHLRSFPSFTFRQLRFKLNLSECKQLERFLILLLGQTLYNGWGMMQKLVRYLAYRLRAYLRLGGLVN
jgi:hypothetical protein